MTEEQLADRVVRNAAGMLGSGEGVFMPTVFLSGDGEMAVPIFGPLPDAAIPRCRLLCTVGAGAAYGVPNLQFTPALGKLTAVAFAVEAWTANVPADSNLKALAGHVHEIEGHTEHIVAWTYAGEGEGGALSRLILRDDAGKFVGLEDDGLLVGGEVQTHPYAMAIWYGYEGASLLQEATASMLRDTGGVRGLARFPDATAPASAMVRRWQSEVAGGDARRGFEALCRLEAGRLLHGLVGGNSGPLKIKLHD